MGTLKAPSITIAFLEKAKTVLNRGERGIVGLILQDPVRNGTDFTVFDGTDIPDDISNENKKHIERALIGNETAPRKIICYIMKVESSNPDYDDALAWVENSACDVVAFMGVATDNKVSDVKTGIIAMRGRHKKVTCVLPECAGDNEGIVGWYGVVYDGNKAEISKEDYCARIAGALAGTGLTSSICYMTLTDVDNCERMSDADIDTAVGQGKLIPMWDGEKVKIVNDVTTFLTTTENKNDSYKVIKLVRDMDLVYSDIYILTKDHYTGKYTNSYDNQCVLLTAINNYLLECVASGLFSYAYLEFNIEKKRKWVKENISVYPDKFVDKNGKPYSYETMTDEDIKRCWSSDKLFFIGRLGLLDTMKNFDFEFLI
ncbi:MAG: phage tail sheath subtilisin-like domain-containing protein [Lachnospiraceae bacterium]|nr:phage tail sheath subtilisin-like domain-containing protein [Lachnospiraceae bacterium]